PAKSVRLFDNSHTSFFESRERVVEIRYAHRDVIDHVTTRLYQWSGALARIDDQTYVAESHRGGRRPDDSERLARGRTGNFAGTALLSTSDRAKILYIPVRGAQRSITVQVDVQKSTRIRGIDFHQRAVGGFHISELHIRREPRKRRVKRDATRKKLFIVCF